MPTHSLFQFVESPDRLTQDILISNSANTPGPGSSMTPHSSCLDKAMLTKVNQLIPCMFCDQTFTHQDELGPHVLAQHPTTFSEPTVLRVEAEFRIPGERNRPKPILPIEKEDVYSCIVCGQISQDALELENHMRKHKDYFYYCCNICGRRFREPWFLKTHMKIHTKSGSKTKALQELHDTPTTINGIVQDASESVATVYKMCMVCGFFFPDHDSLAEHSKVHNRDVELRDKNAENWTKEDEIQKETFMQSLKLQPSLENTTLQPVRTSKWIAQLDPFNTYQAWQLATKGKIAVGPNHAKDIGQEASTDNEECTSDKEELNNILAEGHTVDKANKDGRPPPPPVIMAPPQPQRRSLIQKDKSKERPTTCEECHKTFRTYHQLVLHSRIHKRERPGEESPTAGLEGRLPRAGALEQDEEEGLEEAPLTEILGSGEDCFDRAKGRSKECSYCGKSFRSSYYLTVHLRTHTGEKPFKCAYCDYAAAQKTSLKYHLDRRHKDKPYIEVPIRPASAASSSSLPSPSDLKLEPDSENSSSPTKLWIHETKMYQNEAKFDPSLLVESKPSKPLDQSNSEFAKLITKCADDLPVPVNLKLEKREITDENHDDTPLNLSLKVSLSISTEPSKASIPSTCSQCAFKTIYPEVLIIHKKLAHKDKSDNTRRLAISRQKRHTGCPPALDGKDVDPLPMIFRSHPRRTKSPTPLPSKPQDKTTTNKTTSVPKQSPLRESDGQKLKTQNEQQANSQESRFTEVMRKSTGGAKYLLDMQTPPPDRIGIGERSYPVRNGVLWPTDTSRMCLSSRFGNLPRMDLGEPSTKRLKFSSMTQSREEDAGGEKGSFKNVSEMSNRSLVAGRGSIPGAPSSSQDALGAVKSSSVALGGALDSEWGTMNLLRTCTLNDLASLYHTSPGNPPRTGGRTVLYQHLPTLPNLPRRESPGPFPNQRYGNVDKSA